MQMRGKVIEENKADRQIQEHSRSSDQDEVILNLNSQSEPQTLWMSMWNSQNAQNYIKYLDFGSLKTL